MSNNMFGPNRQSIRLENYDYKSEGLYYITLCVEGRLMLFGNVQNAEMNLSPIGKMVDTAWRGITIYDSSISLDEYIVMPNHLHGVVGIGMNRQWGCHCIGDCHCDRDRDCGRGRCPAPTVSLSDVVRRFKTWTTNQYWNGIKENKWASIEGGLWQRNYYEHIVRDDADLNRIREYIRDNPKNWESDTENHF